MNSENSTYGYWNASDASTWPSVVTASRVARFVNMVMRSTGPYQATPIYWNPFQGKHLLNKNFVNKVFIRRFNLQFSSGKFHLKILTE